MSKKEVALAEIDSLEAKTNRLRELWAAVATWSELRAAGATWRELWAAGAPWNELRAIAESIED